VNRFLAFRCGRDFLEQFISRNPDLIPGLQMMSYFYAVSDVDVVGRLHELGLLPESERLRHLEDIRDLAVSTPDAGFLRPDTVRFITADERASILDHVRTTLLPDLDRCIDHWRDNHNSEEDPEESFSHLRIALNDLREGAHCRPGRCGPHRGRNGQNR
jgi:hypothetical protein